MQFKAKDGSMHGSQMKAFDAGSKPPAAAPADPTADPTQDAAAPKSIQDDPEAMQAVDVLKQKGYTPEDVEQAMDGMGDAAASAPPGGAAATAAAPLNIPGM